MRAPPGQVAGLLQLQRCSDDSGSDATRSAASNGTNAMRPTNAPLSRRCILAAPVLTLPRRANALYDTKTVDAAKATYDVADATKCKEYLPLLDASGKTLDELSTNWDKIATDGDNVRRYLGTVGVTSPLFKIRGGLKGVLKANDLPDAFDAVAFAEASEQFLAELQDAEGDSYGAQFADYSTSVGSGGRVPRRRCSARPGRTSRERRGPTPAHEIALLAPLRRATSIFSPKRPATTFRPSSSIPRTYLT